MNDKGKGKERKGKERKGKERKGKEGEKTVSSILNFYPAFYLVAGRSMQTVTMEISDCQDRV